MLTLEAGKTTSPRAFARLDWRPGGAVRCRPHACHCVCCAAPRGGPRALGRPGGTVRCCPHACHCVCCAAPRGGPRALGRPGGTRQSLFYNGFTLLELLVVIAIIAIGTAGTLAGQCGWFFADWQHRPRQRQSTAMVNCRCHRTNQQQFACRAAGARAHHCGAKRHIAA
jgi:prepilin-type N-terminal cleavage/methylation domain-containing protein